jgi:RNA polymerase sigma-70 factor (ECF subfamily)
MSGEERAEVAARLMSKTGKLDDGEVDELREVWEDVCRTHVKAVFGKLARRVSATDAEDLAQEALADGFCAVCEHGAPGSLRNLLLTIADRKVSRLARDKARHPTSALPPSSSEEKPMSSSSLADRVLARRELAEQARAMLSHDHLEVLRLVRIEKMKHVDAAAALGIPEGTLKSRLLAAKRALHRALEQLTTPSERGATSSEDGGR